MRSLRGEKKEGEGEPGEKEASEQLSYHYLALWRQMVSRTVYV